MPCLQEVGPTTVQQYRDYDADDSESDCSGPDETAVEPSPAAVRARSRGKWLKTLQTVIDRMDGGGGGGGRRPRQVKTILRPLTTYVFVIGMSGLPSKVAVYPRRM